MRGGRGIGDIARNSGRILTATRNLSDIAKPGLHVQALLHSTPETSRSLSTTARIPSQQWKESVMKTKAQPQPTQNSNTRELLDKAGIHNPELSRNTNEAITNPGQTGKRLKVEPVRDEKYWEEMEEFLRIRGEDSNNYR